LLKRALVLGWLLAASNCGQGKPVQAPAFQLEVLGSASAFNTFEVSAERLRPGVGLTFVANHLEASFSSDLPLPSLAHEVFNLSSTKEGQTVSAVQVRPFVCAEDPQFAEKIQSGWGATEKLQAYLLDDGTLTLENEFDRQLTHRCEWRPPSGTSGEGSATVDRSPTLCSESDRLRTNLAIVATEREDGTTAVVTPQYCQAYHLNRAYLPDFRGVLVDQFVGPWGAGGTVTIVLSHCWRGEEVFPKAIPLPLETTCPKEAAQVVTSENGQNVTYSAVSGSWFLENGPLLEGGEPFVADVDLQFSNPDSQRDFSVRGRIDLPIVKLKVSL